LTLEVTADPLVAEEVLAAAGLEAPVQGRGRLAARLAGPLAALEGEVTAELAGARLYGQPLDWVEAAVTLGPGGSVRLTRLTAVRGEGRLTARGTRGADGALAGTLSLDHLSIGAIRLVAERKLPITGTVTAQATLAGSWNAPRLTGRVGLTSAAYEGVPLGDSGVDVTLNWPDLAIRGTLVQREVGVVANLRLAGARPFVVALDLYNPNLAPYLARIAEGRTVRASARGLLRAAGSLDDLEGARAELKLETLRLEIGDFYFQNVGEVALVYERRLLSVVSATLQGPTSQAIFGGQVDLGTRTLDLRVNGGLDLSLARLFTDQLARSRGTVRVVVQAVGPFASPRIFGAAQVEGGALTVRGVDPAISVDDLAGVVVFDATRIVFDNVTMRVGGGPAKLTGAIELAAFTPSLYNLSATFDDVGFAIPKWLPSTSRGDLRLSGRPGDLLLSGRVEVIRAVYNRKIDVNLEALYRAIRAALVPRRATRPEAAGAGPRVDIRITADNDVRVETGLFNGELRANLQLVGRLPEPNLLGSAEVVSGTITFRDTKFTVTSGRADFVDPFRINPSFDLIAEGKVREFQITMRLSGTVDKYRLEFSSTSHPNLTELDVLALLTVGVTTAEARGAVGRPAGAAGQISAAEALAILSGTGLRPIERQVQRFVGVDTFQIDPSVSRSTGAPGPKLTVGKHLNPDVTVTYSIGLGGGGEQTAQIEYRLSTNLALVAQWDEVQSFGGGVKFRFQFR
jgi:autotransporter translocation and assembly factor TamB